MLDIVSSQTVPSSFRSHLLNASLKIISPARTRCAFQFNLFERLKCRVVLRVLILLSTGPLSARELAPIDALAQATPVTSPASISIKKEIDLNNSATFSEDGLPSYRGHLEERLNIPTFLQSKLPIISLKEKRQGIVGSMNSVGLPEAIARLHLRSLAKAYKISPTEIDNLPMEQMQRLPNGAAIVQLGNQVDGIEVFRERANVLLGVDGELIAIGGYVSGTTTSPSTAVDVEFKLSPVEAIAMALQDFAFDRATVVSTLKPSEERGGYSYFVLPAGMPSQDRAVLKAPPRAKRVFFRLPEALVPAYYLEVEVADKPKLAADSYGYVVSAKDGSVLFRHNQRADAKAFSYRVWAEPTPPYLPYPGPQGRNGTPHPTGVLDGYQAPLVPPNLITLANGSISTNDPWLADDATQTTGNNVDAYADLTEPDGFSAGDVRAKLTAPYLFDHIYNATLAPTATPEQTQSSVTHLFYLINWLHDWYYDAGFDEASGNAQLSNYGRGGVEGDPLLAQAQDYSGTDNANMRTPADGKSPQMQMYVFQGEVVNELSLSGGLAEKYSSLLSSKLGPQQIDLTAELILAKDNVEPVDDGCQLLINAEQVVGKILVSLDDGQRSFPCDDEDKAQNAQKAGAVGLLIGKPYSRAIWGMFSNPFLVTSMADNEEGEHNPPITIPVQILYREDSLATQKALLSGVVTAHMYRRPTIDRDGGLDTSVVAHEWGHYISNRLVYNASGLNTYMGAGLGEGWADFHALLLMAKPEDLAVPANSGFEGIYAIGGYVLNDSRIAEKSKQTYFYGLRRYPYSVNIAKNPLTFKHIQDGIPLPAEPATATGSYISSQNSESHNIGQVWATMLWECYASLLGDNQRLSFDEAQLRMKRYLVAAYKMTPPSPTVVEARDALLSVMYSQDPADFSACGHAFAKRGAGSGAVAPDRYDSKNNGVVESFTFGSDLRFVKAGVNDVPGYCDADGILDDKETGTLSLRVRNGGFEPLVSTTATLSSSEAAVEFPSPTVNFPPIPPLTTITASTPIQLKGQTSIQSLMVKLLIRDNTQGEAEPLRLEVPLRINSDVVLQSSAKEEFEGKSNVWTTLLEGNTEPRARWYLKEQSLIDHRMQVTDNVAAGALSALVSPALQVSNSGPFGFSFIHRHNFSFYSPFSISLNGGVIEISTDDGKTWSDIGSNATPTYNGTITSYFQNPLGDKAGYVGQNTNWPNTESVSVNLANAYQGQTVRIRFAAGSGRVVPFGGFGWEVDNIAFTGIDNHPFDAIVPHREKCFSLTTPLEARTLPILTALADPLIVQVKDGDGQPRPSVKVTFSAPTSGPSGTFSDGSTATTIVTDATGNATAPVFTANNLPGSYKVIATIGLQTVEFSLTNVSTSQ